MHHTAKISPTHSLLDQAASMASHRFPAWIDASDFGVPHTSAMPRVRDSLVLRLVAGRSRERNKPFFHATGSP
jgi:hypothetical protein